MTSGGCEVDVRGEGARPPKQCTASSVRAFQRTASFVQVLCHSFGLQTLMWSKLPVLTSKKPGFKFNAYIFEYWPLPPPYVHLTSTSLHSCDECSWAFPVFHWSSASLYLILWMQTEGKTGKAWESKLITMCTHTKVCKYLHNFISSLAKFSVSQHSDVLSAAMGIFSIRFVGHSCRATQRNIFQFVTSCFLSLNYTSSELCHAHLHMSFRDWFCSLLFCTTYMAKFVTC